MRAVMALLAALVVFLLGWALIAGLLYFMGQIAWRARPQAGVLLAGHVLLMWVLSPGVAGYLAIMVTASMFPSVSLPTLYVSFVSVMGVLTVVLFFANIAVYASGSSTLGQVVVFLLQTTAIFVGARLARYFAQAEKTLSTSARS